MKLQKKRRQQARTDYQARLALLKSQKPRVVIRKTNKYITVQLIETEIAQDKVVLTTTSKELLSHGWPKEKINSLKSLQASYLTGLLFGHKAKASTKETILDIGLQRNTKKSRLYAALKGIIDAGIKISHSQEILPSEEELKKNEKLAPILSKLKEKIK